MIKIANPCDADWQKMQPQAEGKFCSSCEKVVVDFSKMSDAQIKEYFITYHEQKTCGHFLTSQVNRPLTLNYITPFEKISNWLNQIPFARAALLLLTSTSIWISSCIKNNDMTTGEPIDTTTNNTKPIMVDTTIKTTAEKDTTALLPGDTYKIHCVPNSSNQPLTTTGFVCSPEPLKPEIRKLR